MNEHDCRISKEEKIEKKKIAFKYFDEIVILCHFTLSPVYFHKYGTTTTFVRIFILYT